MGHVLILRVCLPYLDWDQRCRTKNLLERSHFFHINYLFLMITTLINNMSNKILVDFIESIFVLCMAHIGLVRLCNEGC